MTVIFEDRPSDSLFVETVWRSYSNSSGRFTSVATNHCMIVVAKLYGVTTLYVRGPEMNATSVVCPADGEWLGIQFKYGTFMSHFSVPNLINGEVILPGAGGKSFWLDSSTWQFPDFENADTFVNRLVRQGLLIHEPIVNAVSENQPTDLSLRSVQRRFIRATGMSRRHARLIERARVAAILLRQVSSVPDVIEQTGYADQSHLIRSLRRFIGQTPTQLMDKSEQLSFLFNTTSLT
jgi:AraC-like DNA-binding protein